MSQTGSNISYCGPESILSNLDGIEDQHIYLNESERFSAGTIKKLLQSTSADFLFYFLKESKVILTKADSHRFIEQMRTNNTTWGYSDYISILGEEESHYSLINYSLGSVRNDFDFGAFIVFSRSAAVDALNKYNILEDEQYAGFYGLVLTLSLNSLPTHVTTPLYKEVIDQTLDQHKEHFSYLDQSNRAAQLEFEEVFTRYAKFKGFYLPSNNKHLDFDQSFTIESSVIIPVKNRENTIADAVNSALSQKTEATHNVIVVDNHSSDNTTEILEELSRENSNLVHLIPEETDLMIGGCWNKAINHELCGKFAVQLDSDDLYIDQNTLQTIISAFYAERCAVVVGSYSLVNFSLEEIPPGLIDHREWTQENGHNNGLRINGFGAPRAYYTPIIRKIGFPNVSYGEDYSAMLALTRSYKLGRIYESLYLCRRWDGNSDANLSLDKKNRYNEYKDSLRENEIIARIKLNRDQQS